VSGESNWKTAIKSASDEDVTQTKTEEKSARGQPRGNFIEKFWKTMTVGATITVAVLGIAYKFISRDNPDVSSGSEGYPLRETELPSRKPETVDPEVLRQVEFRLDRANNLREVFYSYGEVRNPRPDAQLPECKTVLTECKTVFAGDSKTGKSSAFDLVRNPSSKMYQYQPTSGVEYRPFVNRSLTFNLCDTAGQKMFRSLTPIYLRGASFVIIWCDLSNQESFEHLRRWVKDARELAGGSIVALACNKINGDGARVVRNDEITKFAIDNNIKWIFIGDLSKGLENMVKMSTH
jgi:small GTP-binding protein